MVAGARSLNVSHSVCQKILENWTWLARGEVDLKSFTLTMELESLDRDLSDADCDYEVIWLELWRPPAKNSLRWSRDEIYRYGRCDDLDNLVGNLHVGNVVHSPGESQVLFKHIVDTDYVLRLCPCRRRGQRHCECEFKEHDLRSYCSDLIRVPENVPAKVFSWCKAGDEAGGGIALRRPYVECDGARVSGVMVSCTPVRGYDKVLVRLHPAENDSIEYCDQLSSGQVVPGVVQEIGNLKRLNDTHGTFVISSDELRPSATYCITLELLGNPYCQQPDVDLSPAKDLRRHAPSVCSAQISEPLRTSDHCGGSATPVLAARQNNTVFLVLCSSVPVVVLAVAAALIYHYLCRRGSRRGGLAEHKLTSIISGRTDDSKKSHLGFRGKKVFLLHFPDSAAPSNARFSRQLVSLGHTVVDPGDETNAEEIAAEHEAWAVKRLDECDKVIVIQRTDSPTHSEKQPLMADDDGLNSLRVHALQHARAHYALNYKKLCVLSYSFQQSSDLSDLTPQRCWRLPEHLDQVTDWVADGRPKCISEAAKKELQNLGKR